MDPCNIPNEYFGSPPMYMDLDQFLSFKMTNAPRHIIGDPRSRFISDPTNDPISDPSPEVGKTHFEVDFGKLRFWKLKLVSKFLVVSESESKSESGFKTGIEVLVKSKPVSESESKLENGFEDGIEVLVKLKPVSKSESKSENCFKTGIEFLVKSEPVSKSE